MQTGLIKGDFLSKYISQALTAYAGFPEIFCELEVGARQHPRLYHFKKFSFFTSEPACTQFGSLMLTVLFCRIQNHLPHTLQTQASTSRETGISGNIFLTAEMSFPDGNKPALSSSCSAMKTGAALTDGSSLRLNGKNFPHFYKAVGISLPSSDAFLAEPSPAIRSRITSL